MVSLKPAFYGRLPVAQFYFIRNSISPRRLTAILTSMQIPGLFLSMISISPGQLLNDRALLHPIIFLPGQLPRHRDIIEAGSGILAGVDVVLAAKHHIHQRSSATYKQACKTDVFDRSKLLMSTVEILLP